MATRRATPVRRRSRRPAPGDHVRHNRAVWDRQSTGYDRRHSSVLGGRHAAAWGVFRVPESDLRLFGPVRGRRVLELGCGAARWSIALARRGARPTGLDLSSSQLAKARGLQDRAGVRFPLVRERRAPAVPGGSVRPRLLRLGGDDVQRPDALRPRVRPGPPEGRRARLRDREPVAPRRVRCPEGPPGPPPGPAVLRDPSGRVSRRFGGRVPPAVRCVDRPVPPARTARRAPGGDPPSAGPAFELPFEARRRVGALLADRGDLEAGQGVGSALGRLTSVGSRASALGCTVPRWGTPPPLPSPPTCEAPGTGRVAVARRTPGRRSGAPGRGGRNRSYPAPSAGPDRTTGPRRSAPSRRGIRPGRSPGGSPRTAVRAPPPRTPC